MTYGFSTNAGILKFQDFFPGYTLKKEKKGEGKGGREEGRREVGKEKRKQGREGKKTKYTKKKSGRLNPRLSTENRTG